MRQQATDWAFVLFIAFLIFLIIYSGISALALATAIAAPFVVILGPYYVLAGYGKGLEMIEKRYGFNAA